MDNSSTQELITKHKNGCYNDKNPDECFIYGEFLKKQNELQKAVRLFRVNCDENNHGASCLEYGNMAFTGSKQDNVTPNFQEALKYFEKSCSLGNVAGCFNSGMILVSPLLNSIGIPRDYVKGMAYLNQSCDKNNGNACLYLSGMYLAGVDNTTPLHGLDKEQAAQVKPTDFQLQKDMAKAFSFTEKACNLKSWQACANLSSWYLTGNGTEKNPEKAQHYKDLYQKLRDEETRNRLMTAFHP